MNFQDSIEYMQSVRESFGDNGGGHIAFHEHVTTEGQVWVIDERTGRNPWRNPRTPQPDEPEQCSRFYAACVIENVGHPSYHSINTRGHDVIRLSDWGLFHRAGRKGGSGYPHYVRTLEEAVRRADEIDVARATAWHRDFHAREAQRAAEEAEERRLNPECDYEMQTWEWDKKLGRDVPVYHSKFKVIPTGSEIYGGEQ